MFGYVRLHKPAIRMGEYEQYQGIYCTLCRRIGRRYGLLMRLTLSYDMTFLALMQMAAQPDDPGFCRGHCSFNPTKRCLRCQHTDAIDRAADIGVLLTYAKLQDTLHDEGFFGRLAAAVCLPVAALARRKAEKRQPQAWEQIAAMTAAQHAVEEERCASVDRAAEPFARLLAQLASAPAADERQRTVLDRFGYCLGRWVYLIDAVDDMADDLKKKSYNPYILSKNIQPGDDLAPHRAAALGSLNACLAECVAAYELMEIRRFDGIIRNILEWGMPAAERRVITGGETCSAAPVAQHERIGRQDEQESV